MIEENVYSALSNHAGLTALVGSNIFHGQAGQGTVLPYISYYVVFDDPINTVDGVNGTNNTSIQVDIFGESATQARNIAVQVRDAFNSAATFKSVQGSKRGPKWIDPGYQYCQVEFSTWHQ